ncbi:hypothetical protein BDV12DRAFT_196003 [Aspergillus spectabilis]
MSTTTSYYNLPAGPSPDWVRFKPAPHKCAACTLCTTGLDCPAVAHPYNTEAHKGLRCYLCSACSHHGYTGKDADLPMAHKPAPERFYSTDHCWYVFVPLEDMGNSYNSLILRLRVALAEMNNAKATIFAKSEREQVPAGTGLVVEVWMKKSTGANAILDEAREIIRGGLRANAQLFLMEEAMGLSDV